MEEKTEIIEPKESDSTSKSSDEQGFEEFNSITLFEKFEDSEKKELFKIGTFHSFKPHSNIVIEGEKSRGIYIIIEGTVSVYKNDIASNSMIRLTYLEKGAIFGELSLFDDIPRSATVTTETDCHIFNLDYTKFIGYLEEKGDHLKFRFYKKCAEEIAERFRIQNDDYIVSQNLLWKYGLRKDKEDEEVENKSSEES